MTCAEATRSFAPVRAVWRELLGRLPWSTIFMTPEWQEAWWDEFGNVLARYRNPDGEPAPRAVA